MVLVVEIRVLQIHLKEHMLMLVSLSSQKSSMVLSISSWCHIPSPRVPSSQLISMSHWTHQRSPKMQSWTLLMPCATTTTIGLTLSKFQLLVCLQTRLPSIVVRLVISHRTWICINFHSSSERPVCALISTERLSKGQHQLTKLKAELLYYEPQTLQKDVIESIISINKFIDKPKLSEMLWLIFGVSR